jgi:3'-5' exoribonuclease
MQPTPNLLSIQALEKLLQQQPQPIHATIHAQITNHRLAQTKNQKNYLNITLADSTSTCEIKIWNDQPAYESLSPHPKGAFFAFTAYWSLNSYGLNYDQLTIAPLTPEQIETLLIGPREQLEKIEHDYNTLCDFISEINDPRLRRLCEEFLTEYEEPFRRAAAARDFHHAHRGGLIEHIAQMMRAAIALSQVYPQANRDLLIAGVLFHDVGKLWENDYEKQGFTMPYTLTGELLGHITVGIEFVNRLWKSLEDDPDFQIEGTPSLDLTRRHLLHLIASHHGQREFGAPVTPRTPEAWILHYVDNLDARIEMLHSAYQENALLAPHIYEPRRPLEGRPVQPLPPWKPA